MTKDLFACPVCGAPLAATGPSYICPARHTFDIARQGYVNLLRGRPAPQHGDNREMLNARRDFLNAGYYEPLCSAVTEVAVACAPADPCVLDAGCGECYYTDRVERALAARGMGAPCVAGVDISREALALGARRNKSLALAVASAYHLPFPDARFDLLLCLFAPYAGEEFVRVLRPGGHMILVIPEARHLFGLKEILYERPYENRVADTALPGFRLLERRTVARTVTVTGPTDIENLFKMTPYYYRTSPADREKLAARSSLTTELSFAVLVYEKE